MKKLFLLAFLTLATIGATGVAFYAPPVQACPGPHHTS
jgi:hypothetical protein